MGHFKEDVSSEVGLYQTSINNQTETYLGQWDKGVFEGIGINSEILNLIHAKFTLAISRTTQDMD